MNNSEKDAIRRDRSALVAELETAGAKFRGNDCTCPFHNDKRPSASIYEKKSVWRFQCHKNGCGISGDVFDVMARNQGKTVVEILGGGKKEKSELTNYKAIIKGKKAVMQWFGDKSLDYRAHWYYICNGKPVGIVFRLWDRLEKDKTYRPVVILPGDRYAPGAFPAPRPLYNHDIISKNEKIIITEGEKSADALMQYGIAAVTSSGGSQAADKTNWNPLKNKEVIVWPDNDAAGANYAKDVVEILSRLEPPPRISILGVGHLGEKEDAADVVVKFREAFGDEEIIRLQLHELLKQAKPYGPSSGLADMLQAVIDGKREVIPWPWKAITGLSQSLMPETLTLICGSAGSYKSFSLLQSVTAWYKAKIKFACYMLEDSQESHTHRILAQQDGNNELTDLKWIKNNPTETMDALSRHRQLLDGITPHIYANPKKLPTLNELAAWTESRAKEGCRIISIDPVTLALKTTSQPWNEELEFLGKIKKTAVDYQCSIVLMMHPTKQISNPDMSQIAGAAAYTRFSQSVFWIERHDDKTSDILICPGNAIEKTYNATMHILKTRHGKGGGCRVAMQFDQEDLSLYEVGVVTSNNCVDHQESMNYRAELKLKESQTKERTAAINFEKAKLEREQN